LFDHFFGTSFVHLASPVVSLTYAPVPLHRKCGIHDLFSKNFFYAARYK